MRTERLACLKEINAVFKAASKNCNTSVKGIKRGQAPLSVLIPIGHNENGQAQDQVVTYFYEKGCKADVKFLWRDYKAGWDWKYEAS